MLHDMGYFYPYPARLSSLQQLPQNNSLLSRIRSAQSNNLLTRCLLTLKRLSLWVVKKMFARKVDTYLVPSPFMKPMVESWGDKDKEVMIL